MHAPDLPTVELSDFAARADHSEAAIGLLLSGNADWRAREHLDALFKAAHDQAVAMQVPEVVVDMEALEFMNSSCFKSLMSWIVDVSELAEDEQYMVRFRSSSKMPWQRRSLRALVALAEEVIIVETDGAPS